MIFLLATLLSFGWPKEQTIFVDQEPKGTGYIRVHLNTCCGSMRPAIQGGEVALVERYLPGQPLVPGQVVSDGRVLHRVVAVSRDGVKLSGDANHYSDEWQPKSNIQYIVRIIVRKSHK